MKVASFLLVPLLGLGILCTVKGITGADLGLILGGAGFLFVCGLGCFLILRRFRQEGKTVKKVFDEMMRVDHREDKNE